MTADNGWENWGDAWREDGRDAAGPALDVDAIEARGRREQLGQSVRARLDLVGCLLALGVCAWVMVKGDPPALALGLAGLAFTLFGLVVTLGRERTPQALASRTVAAALGWELATARAGVRSSIGGLLVAAAALVFLAVCAFVFQREGLLAPGGRAVYPMTAALLFTAGSSVFSAWMLRRRRARVRQLEALLADLTET